MRKFKNRLFMISGLALALSACSQTTNYYGTDGKAEAAAPVPSASNAQEALRHYYAGLQTKLPVAPKGVSLPADKTITRIAFGSCLNENRDMHVWNNIAAQKPDAFLFIGDNVYGDTGTTNAADIPTLPASYRKLSARKEFADFRAKIPMMTAWDDHDYGANDAGGSFAFKEWAETIYETYWGASAEVKSRPGIYESRIVGPEGKRVQFIILDTRFFRSDLARRPYQKERPKLGWYIPNMDPDATILGDAQWQWLDAELSKPADLRLIISSTQIITSAHGYESWYNFPKQREKLYKMLASKGVDNSIFLTGDRHSGAFYQEKIDGLSRPVTELTASSLNYAFGNGDSSEREPDGKRLGGFWSIPNFGQLDIDWNARKVTMTLRKDDGSVIESRETSF